MTGDTFKSRTATTAEFLDWARKARYGDWAVYHIGNLAFDRWNDRALHNMADTVSLFADTGFVVPSQATSPAKTENTYMATRTGRGHAPRSVLAGRASARDFRALRAIIEREAAMSAARALRYRMMLSEQAAIGLLEELSKRGLIARIAYGGGWELTDKGRALAV